MTPTSGLEPSYIAIGLVALLLVVCIVLYRSMRHQMSKINVPTREEIAEQRRGEGPSSASTPR